MSTQTETKAIVTPVVDQRPTWAEETQRILDPHWDGTVRPIRSA